MNRRPRNVESVSDSGKPVVRLKDRVKTPPFSSAARLESGSLLRQLPLGESLTMPHSRPMPSIGKRCHELRVRDEGANWRIIYRLDPDAVVVALVFSKKTQRTPDAVIRLAKRIFTRYDDVLNERADEDE